MFTDATKLVVSWEFVGDKPVLHSVMLNGTRVDEEMSPWLLEYILSNVIDSYEAELNASQSYLD